MNAEIISIGHELLMGEIVDTNTSFIARQLADIGITVGWTGIVGDDIDHLTKAFNQAFERTDVLITTGGLGPTSDDLTREALAQVAGEKMTIDPASQKQLIGIFEGRGINMPKTNLKQAMLIPSSSSIPNSLGTAPGWWFEQKDRLAILMPGPPRELQQMWFSVVAPRLSREFGTGVVVTRTIKTNGITEGGIDEMLSHMFGNRNPYLGIYARPDGIHLRIIARATTYAKAQNLINPIEKEIRSVLGGAIWGVDDETPGGTVGEILRKSGLTMGSIEGVSAGMFASNITRVSDYSAFYKGSLFITRDNVICGDNLLNIEIPSEASQTVSLRLAKVAKKFFDADIGIGITHPLNIANSNPAGTYWIGIVGPTGSQIEQALASYTQEVNAQRAATAALVGLSAALRSNKI